MYIDNLTILLIFILGQTDTAIINFSVRNFLTSVSLALSIRQYLFYLFYYNAQIFIKAQNQNTQNQDNNKIFQLERIGQMGCSNVSGIDAPIKLPIPYQISNNCVDQFPIFVIIKIKDKFDMNCRDHVNGMLFEDFKKLYGHLNLDQLVMKKLYDFFADYRRQVLKFKMFMSKYATIIKCDDQTLAKIIFEIHKTEESDQELSMQDYQKMIQTSRRFFGFKPANPKQKDSLTQNQFFKLLNGSGFYWKDWRNMFNLIEKDDIPFQAINRELVENQINDLQIGSSYYVISAGWFQRWAYYYAGQNHTVDQNSIKSAKLLSKDKKSMSKLSMNRKIYAKQQRKGNSINISQKSIIDQSLVQQPLRIQTQDIQGQYPGELKEGLRPAYQCKYLNERLWKMMSSMHPPVQVFRRIATTKENLELYPKTIYYFQTNDDGRIDYSTAQRYLLGIRSNLSKLNPQKNVTFFVKNFKDKNWTEQKVERMLGQISVGQRFFVVATTNRIGFIEKNTRAQISMKNLSLGDKVYVDFPYEKKISQAYILSFKQRQEKIKIHYIGYSYRYQTEVSIQDITLDEVDMRSSMIMTSTGPMTSPKKSQYIFKGIQNIGNTCFVNSIIQCLFATPVLDQYFQNARFDKKNAPLLYSITNLAKKLLKNQSQTPYDLKKAVDLNLPAFSGNDQHDAQEFLCLLLDKLSDEHRQKPTVVDQLFGGKIRSKLVCAKCQTVKNVEQNFYTLSLPIPEAEFNYYTVMVIPIYTQNMQKIVMKLHKSAKLFDYLQSFQDRISQSKSDFLFVEVVNGTLKKVKTDMMNQANQKKKLFQMGLAPSNEIYAFQKLQKGFINELVRTRDDSQSQFHDYFHQQNNQWGIVKLGESRKEYYKAEFLNPDNQIESIKISKKDQKNLFTLGTKVNDVSYRKLYHRKYNSVLKKFESFGLEMLIGIPKWASYHQISEIIQKTIENLKSGSSSLGQSGKQRKSRKDLSTLFRFVDPSKLRCIFCDKDLSNSTFNQENNVCCSILEKRIPMFWASKKKNFLIYVDWVNTQRYNSHFFQHIQVDQMSQAIEDKRSQEKINLQECLNLFKQPQKVQMQCDKCKNNIQTLQTMIQAVPNILVLHMKEFRYTSQGHLIKLDVRLKWQEYLDIGSYSLNDRGTLYQLFAFIRHIGNSQSGHYTCMTKRKHPIQNKRVWVNFDDEVTNIIKISKDDIDNAYLLFFKKVDMPTSAYLNFTGLQQMGSLMLENH